MLLGDLIAKIQDQSFAAEALVALDDLALMSRIAAAAADRDMPTGEFAAQAIGRFIDNATDEDWLTLVGLMSRADNPGQVFLRRVLLNALAVPATIS